MDARPLYWEHMSKHHFIQPGATNTFLNQIPREKDCTLDNKAGILQYKIYLKLDKYLILTLKLKIFKSTGKIVNNMVIVALLFKKI